MALPGSVGLVPVGGFEPKPNQALQLTADPLRDHTEIL